jgi:hypothetical protein
MAFVISRADIQRTIELLELVVANADNVRDVADAARLYDLYRDQLDNKTIVIP